MHTYRVAKGDHMKANSTGEKNELDITWIGLK